MEEPDTGLCWEAFEEHVVEHMAAPDNHVVAVHSSTCNRFEGFGLERRLGSGFLFFELGGFCHRSFHPDILLHQDD